MLRLGGCLELGLESRKEPELICQLIVPVG
jgi:hypothetical protein